MSLISRRPALAACLMLPLLSGCASLRLLDERAGPGTPIAPIAAPTSQLPASASQTLHAAFGRQSISLSCGLQSAAGSWRAVCVNALGLRVLTLGQSSDGQLTAERGEGVPEALDPKRVLADLQLALWPQAALEAAYQGSDWSIEQPSPETRRLRHQQRLVAEVHYASPSPDTKPWDGPLWLANLAIGYTLGLITEADAPP